MNENPGTPPDPEERRGSWWVHLPLLFILIGVGPAYGYYASDHLMTGFDLLGWLPLAIGGWFLLFTISALFVGRTTSKGRRGSVLLLHFIMALFVTTLALMLLPAAGKWIWEQAILKPRREAMMKFARGQSASPQGPLEVAGYRFELAERTADGAMFYTVMAGGPFVSSGIYVPLSPNYRGFEPPQKGEPPSARSVVPTSVPGLFRFVTRD